MGTMKKMTLYEMDERINHDSEIINKIKKIRKQYGFPLWLIKEALEYYDEDEDKAIEKLIEIYNVIGDNPDIAIRKNIEGLMGKVATKKLPPLDTEVIFSNNLKNINY